MSPKELANEIALYLQENHQGSFDGIGYSTTSAGFGIKINDKEFYIDITEMGEEE